MQRVRKTLKELALLDQEKKKAEGIKKNILQIWDNCYKKNSSCCEDCG